MPSERTLGDLLALRKDRLPWAVREVVTTPDPECDCGNCPSCQQRIFGGQSPVPREERGK
jgi:hypothetical protein